MTAKRFALEFYASLNQQEQGQDYGRAFEQAVARMALAEVPRVHLSEASCCRCSGLRVLAQREWRQVPGHWAHSAGAGRRQRLPTIRASQGQGALGSVGGAAGAARVEPIGL
jgi:hypothetical protein